MANIDAFFKLVAIRHRFRLRSGNNRTMRAYTVSREQAHISIDEHISIAHLRLLAAMIREPSITRTAELLELSQPTVSKMLRRLRIYFGDPLLVRVGASMQPTYRALQMQGSLRELLARADEVRTISVPFDPANSSRVFTVLVTDVGMIRFLPPLMAAFEKAGSNLSLNALPFDSNHFEAKLESGEADIALGYLPRANSNMRCQKLYDDTYLSVVRAGHPRLAGLSSYDAFFAERHIIVIGSTTGHEAHQSVARAFESRLPKNRIQLRLSSFSASAAVVKRTDAITTMPAYLAQFMAAEFGLATLTPPLELPRIEISQYWHERVNNDPAHRWFRSISFELFAGGALA